MTPPTNFDEYYQYYLTLHQKRWTKIFHIAGNFATIFYIVFCISLIRTSIFYSPSIILTPFIVYPFAWYSHLFIEKNKPAAWTNPLWAKMCDWKMIYEVFTGKIAL